MIAEEKEKNIDNQFYQMRKFIKLKGSLLAEVEEMKRVEDSYEQAEVINQQVMELLVEVKLDDLLEYAETLAKKEYRHIQSSSTRHEVCGVITRCLTLHSDVCSTADEVVKSFTDFQDGKEKFISNNSHLPSE